LKARVQQAIEKGITAILGDSDVSKSAIALLWGFGIVLVLKFSSDMVYFGIIHEGEGGPELNTSIPVLIADHVTTFGTIIVAAYVAAWLAPARPFRHAILCGLPFYLAAPVGVFRQWGVVPAWQYVVMVLVALAGAAIAGWLQHVQGNLRRNRSGAV